MRGHVCRAVFAQRWARAQRILVRQIRHRLATRFLGAERHVVQAAPALQPAISLDHRPPHLLVLPCVMILNAKYLPTGKGAGIWAARWGGA
jgi:hypothetical protein